MNGGNNAACGNVARDAKGNLIFGFAHKLDNCSVLEVKLWGLYHEICLTWGRGYHKVVIESNSANAIELLCAPESQFYPLFNLMQGIKKVVVDQGLVDWKHIDRDRNGPTDLLAKESLSMDINCKFFDSLHDFLIDSLDVDLKDLH